MLYYVCCVVVVVWCVVCMLCFGHGGNLVVGCNGVVGCPS